MTLSYSKIDIDYPDSDGLPMAESDAARDYLIYGVEALSIYFQNQSEVYVSGNLFIYYEEGNPKAVVAPDVFVVFGVEKKKRLSYKVWQENHKIPDFVLEITSKSTASEDRGNKRGLYAYLGVKDYFQYDPTADYLTPPLQGFSLHDGNYWPISSRETEEGLAIFSQVLGLELHWFNNGEMRFVNPINGDRLLSFLEMDQARQQAEQKNLKLADKLRELGIDPDQL